MAKNKAKSTPGRRVGIYCRISDDRKQDESGVERQEEACKKFCKEKGWDVVNVYTDNDISATQTKKTTSPSELR